MSLQIWLPLNGDLMNQGLSSAIISGTPVYATTGKIGGKSLNTGMLSITASDAAKILNNKTFSYACWIYVNADTGVTSGCSAFFGRESMSSGGNRQFTLFQYNNVNSLHWSWQNNTVTDSSTFTTGILPNVFPSRQWTHLAVTYENPVIKFYINGKLKHTVSNAASNSSSFNYTLPVAVGSASRYLNDVRIYDHCLSAKEVKELSKGLVLHYRLAGPGGNNLIPGTSTANVSSEWSANGWGNTKLTQYDSINGIYKIVATNGWIVNKYKFNPSYVGKTLTISFWAKKIGNETTSTIANNLWLSNTTGSNPYYTSNFFIVDNGGTNTTGSTGIPASDVWMKYVGTCVLNADGQLGIGCFCSPENNSLKTTYLIKELKVEEGSVATPWCPNPGDALYSAMGYNNNIEYDCSGFKNNGIIKYSPVWDVNSPRYTTSYKFDGTAYLTIPNPFPIGTVVREFSHTAWIKWDSSCNISNGIHSIAYDNSFFRFALGKENQMWAYGVRCAADGSGETQTGILQHGTPSSLINGKWYFIAITFKDGVCKAYLDGEQVDSTTSTKVGLKSKTSYGAIGAYSSWGDERAIGNISDSRFYATELSAADIQELYHSAVIVDNTGKTYAYEYFEAN